MLHRNRFITGTLVIGVMFMTACGSSIDRNNELQSLRRETSRATSLSGTWEGSLNCDTGENIPSVLKIADTGNPVFEYMSKSGNREVELTHRGRTLGLYLQKEVLSICWLIHYLFLPIISAMQ